MKIKELTKFLKEWYWKNDQRLVVDTFDDRTYEPHKNWCHDVHLKNENDGTFLFSISNYQAMFDMNRTNGGEIYDYFDTTTVASLPYYMNEHFFIRKWTPLTDEDIYDCTKYFVEKVLSLKYEIWNIRVNPQSNAKQLELELEYK